METEGLKNLCFADSTFAERYEGWDEVGVGKYGVVVKTTSKITGKVVALKIFSQFDERMNRRFGHEVTAAQDVTSRYVVRVQSPFVRGSTAWIEMEFIDGPNLDDELRRRRQCNEPWSFSAALEIAVAITEAIKEAHAQGIVHRDVKPGNIFLPKSGTPPAKLGDFGIARINDELGLTQSEIHLGTPLFTSPEAISAVADGTTSALKTPHDIYGLGLVLYVLFANNHGLPLPEGDTADLVYAYPGFSRDLVLRRLVEIHQKGRPIPIRDLDPSLPEALEDVLSRCFIKNRPSDRPTADQVLEVLTGLRSRDDSVPKASPSRTPKPRAALAAAGVAAVLFAGALLLNSGSNEEATTQEALAQVPPAESLPAPTDEEGQNPPEEEKPEVRPTPSATPTSRPTPRSAEPTPTPKRAPTPSPSPSPPPTPRPTPTPTPAPAQSGSPELLPIVSIAFDDVGFLRVFGAQFSLRSISIELVDANGKRHRASIDDLGPGAEAFLGPDAFSPPVEGDVDVHTAEISAESLVGPITRTVVLQ